MTKRGNARRDRFAFALGSVTLATPFVTLPIVPDDGINRAIDRKLGGAPGNRRDTVRVIEDFLACYFAAGCRQAA